MTNSTQGKSEELSVGDVFEFKFPFVRYAEKDWNYGYGLDESEDAFEWLDRWKPATDYRFCPPDYFDSYCDAEGKCRLTVVGVNKPEGFPTRVFFTREWMPPNDDKYYGLNKCRVISLGRFKQMKRGYFKPYYIADKGVDAAREEALSIKEQGQ